MENLNKYINYKLDKLEKSNKTFEDIFEIMHDNNNHVFCEYQEGFSIIKITYDECRNNCLKMGSLLSDRLNGIESNSFIGLSLDNSPSFIYTFWGLLMAGYRPVLINKRLGKVLNESVIEMADIKAIITDDILGYELKEIDINEFDLEDVVIKDEFNWANEIALTTSATSLNVKVCIYDGSSFAAQVSNTKHLVKANPMLKARYNGEIKQLAFLPFYHVFGLVASYFWYGFFNRTFVFLQDLATDTIKNTIIRHKVTHVFAVPMVWHTIYKTILREVNKKDEKTINKFNKGLKLSLFIQNICPSLGARIANKLFKEVCDKAFGDSIRCMITGGSYINPDALRVINGIGYPLYNGYGMSEIAITSVECRRKSKYRLSGSIGKPLKTVSYMIGDNNTLLVKGSTLCSKIISKDNVSFISKDEWFDTKDIANVDKKGNYFLSGRFDDVVISSSGEKINPDVIEKVLFLPSVTRYSVLGYGENNQLSIILEVPSKPNAILLGKIISEVDNALVSLKEENYNIERVYYTHDPIASAQAIKVSRSILKKYINDGKVVLHPYHMLKEMEVSDDDLLHNVMCSEIIEMMALILDINKDEIKPNTNFIMDLGGSSLDYLDLVLKIGEKFEVEFNADIRAFTASDLANYVIERNRGV